LKGYATYTEEVIVKESGFKNKFHNRSDVLYEGTGTIGSIIDYTFIVIGSKCRISGKLKKVVDKTTIGYNIKGNKCRVTYR